MTVRERNRRAYEYLLRCKRKRLNRILRAATVVVWLLLAGCVVLCICANNPADEPEMPPVEATAGIQSAIPAAYLTKALPRVGTFEICGYCACCTPYADINQRDGKVLTASGKWVEIGQCVAVDTDIIPLGSTVIIDGNTYTALDTGVTGYVIDILMSHEEAATASVRTEVVTWE